VLCDVLLDTLRRVVDRRGAETRDHVVIAHARRGEHLCAERPRKLHRHVSYAARPALHKHGLPHLQLCAIYDPHIRRDEHQRQRSSFAHRQIGRLQCQQICVDGRILSERTLDTTYATRHAVDLVSRFKPSNAGINCFNHSR
jgi:hypothetical protein